MEEGCLSIPGFGITSKEIENCFNEFHFNLTKLQKKNTDESSFRFFDYVNWAKSKITGQSFKDLKKLAPVSL